MGRHSTTDQTEFYRTAATWFLPWALAAIVGIGALWIAVDAIGGDVASPPDDQAKAVAHNPSPSESPDAEPSPSASPTPEPDPLSKEKPGKHKLVADGVPVQVLNGTSVADADDLMADKLARLGFDIIAINTWHPSPTTVVYWSTAEGKKAAELLADKYGWHAEPQPGDLSTEVTLHVLVGADEAEPG